MNVPPFDKLPPLSAFAQFHNADTPEQAMVLACRRLLATSGQSTPPIRLQELLPLCHARKVERDIATPGLLEIHGHTYVVVVRKGINWRRQRFTIAHELGHILLLNALVQTPSLLAALRAPEHWAQAERLCNLAAAELLIPQEDLLRELQKFQLSSRGLLQLYDRYMTSLTPLFIRLSEVLPGSSVSLWRKHARHPHEPEALRVVRCIRHKDGPWLPAGLTAKHLNPPLVEFALERGEATNVEVEFKLGGRCTRLDGVAIRFPLKRSALSLPLPILGNARVADEDRRGFDVFLLLKPTN